MEDRLSGVQEVLDGFRKKLDDIQKSLSEQKQYDMGLKIDALRTEMQGQIDRLSKDMSDLQSRAAGLGVPEGPPAVIKPA